MNLYTVLSIFSIVAQCWCSPMPTPKIQIQTEDTELNEAINSLNTATDLLNNDPTYLNLVKEVEKVIRNENQKVDPIEDIKQEGHEVEYDTTKLIIKTPEQRKNVVNMYFPFVQGKQQHFTPGDIVRQLQQKFMKEYVNDEKQNSKEFSPKQHQSKEDVANQEQIQQHKEEYQQQNDQKQQKSFLAEQIAEYQQQENKMQQKRKENSDGQEQHQYKDVANQEQKQQYQEEYVASHQQESKQPQQQENFSADQIAEYQQQKEEYLDGQEQQNLSKDVANQEKIQQYTEEYVTSPQQNSQQENYQQQSQQPFFAYPQQLEDKMQQNREDCSECQAQLHQSKDVANQEQILQNVQQQNDQQQSQQRFFASPQQQENLFAERIAEYQQEIKMQQDRGEYVSPQQNDQQQNDQQFQQPIVVSPQQQQQVAEHQLQNNMQPNEQQQFCRLNCDNAETHKPICAINANNKYSVFENVCSMQLSNCLNPGIGWQPITREQCKNTVGGLFNILHRYLTLEDKSNENIIEN